MFNLPLIDEEEYSPYTALQEYKPDTHEQKNITPTDKPKIVYIQSQQPNDDCCTPCCIRCVCAIIALNFISGLLYILVRVV